MIEVKMSRGSEVISAAQYDLDNAVDAIKASAGYWGLSTSNLKRVSKAIFDDSKHNYYRIMAETFNNKSNRRQYFSL